MFYHGYDNYMERAFPADELMPLSCKGRVRGRDKSRGDIDDALGHFSLTLIDTLDTLVILNNITEFKRAIGLVEQHVKFDTDVVVSTFETNIRVLGGLLAAHALMLDLRGQPTYRELLASYDDGLLKLAVDLGDRLMKAFDTPTGIPYSKINLRHGVTPEVRSSDVTCTACAGTLIMEFAALSRFAGNPVYEQAARRALEAIWIRRGSPSDLVGTTINISSGAWHRTDAGVGAGVDSYYEYLFKAFMLLGDQTYLQVFNTHYSGIMKHLRRGPFLVDTHIHKPHVLSKKYMDALQTFFPGLQVLKGDLLPAIETHRMYFDVLQRHKFFPEAFFSDFRVNWGNSPLRPEFAESTYFLYTATDDPAYLEIGEELISRLNSHARVTCGWAAIKDVRVLSHEDKMDSFVLAETFKYLYLLFANEDDVPIRLDDYVFTTEAHLLPTKLANVDMEYEPPVGKTPGTTLSFCFYSIEHASCLFGFCSYLAAMLVSKNSSLMPGLGGPNIVRASARGTVTISPAELDLSNEEHIAYLYSVGITVENRQQEIRLVHDNSGDRDPTGEGFRFIRALMQYNQQVEQGLQRGWVGVRFRGALVDDLSGMFKAGPAAFGPRIGGRGVTVYGQAVLAEPLTGCTSLPPAKGAILVVSRGDCMFVDKVRHAEASGAVGVLVIDNAPQEDDEPSLFTMSGDDGPDPAIPAAFLFRNLGQRVVQHLYDGHDFTIRLDAWHDKTSS
ncbi:uncharacterized protein MONBRDRAFT_13474 [Monosiga brevicollis MX1]|uniref:alpha-1,2-Mannosidase n=1 Tax=Monosiga brevicollis TaxID=81824 RepID=A9UPZ7_MONBE|nr:uncharacterized protein MONBRDRAFT_13474 [Monosiga brevicollis MX1]EDQ92960.1 predicted protein [Monosiga brevicollis MX1]|eukprot:XP_001742722.1 hypothetical protein [Monosiga brevicollis MX1]